MMALPCNTTETDWREVVRRRFPEAYLLPPLKGDGPWVVMSTCFHKPGVFSLHPSLERAREVLADLNSYYGCSKIDRYGCKGKTQHHLIDLREFEEAS